MTAMLGAGGKIVVKAPVIPAAAVRLQQCFPQVQHQHTGAVLALVGHGLRVGRDLHGEAAAVRGPADSRSCTSVSGIGHG